MVDSRSVSSAMEQISRLLSMNPSGMTETELSVGIDSQTYSQAISTLLKRGIVFQVVTKDGKRYRKVNT